MPRKPSENQRNYAVMLILQEEPIHTPANDELKRRVVDLGVSVRVNEADLPRLKKKLESAFEEIVGMTHSESVMPSVGRHKDYSQVSNIIEVAKRFVAERKVPTAEEFRDACNFTSRQTLEYHLKTYGDTTWTEVRKRIEDLIKQNAKE